MLQNGNSVCMDTWPRDTDDITWMLLDKDIHGKRPTLRRARIRWMDNITVERYENIIWPRVLGDQMTEDRKWWSKMVEEVDTR